MSPQDEEDEGNLDYEVKAIMNRPDRKIWFPNDTRNARRIQLLRADDRFHVTFSDSNAIVTVRLLSHGKS